jgi:nicotinamide mononucleotide (NMN) deamidase PncC
VKTKCFLSIFFGLVWFGWERRGEEREERERESQSDSEIQRTATTNTHTLSFKAVICKGM